MTTHFILKVLLGRCGTAVLAVVLLSSCSLFSHKQTVPSFPQIEECRDQDLQEGLERALHELSLAEAAKEHRLSVELVDITDLSHPRAAGVNPDHMMYAASLPKIAILFALLKRVEDGSREWNPRISALAKRMIRVSSNDAATELFHLVGPEYIASLLSSPQYGLYRIDKGGGMWVGKEYGKGDAWKRDPLKQLSHAASAMAVARFYYLLETGRLLTPKYTILMKEIMAQPALDHKFVKGLRARHGKLHLLRKGGSWGNFHSDSVLVERDGRKYIAVALTEDPNGADWLENLIVRMDQLVFTKPVKSHWSLWS